jgi:cellulose biosynthesis protein BcsQ
MLQAPVVSPAAIPVLSIGNLKGGVGKTTIVANLASALVQSGMRVLAVDLDFQASLSVALPPVIVPRFEDEDGAAAILLGAPYDMFHDHRFTGRGIGRYDGLSLVRTSLDLAEVEDRLFAKFILRKDEDDPRFALARQLSNPRLRNDYDLVMIDTPPRLTMASVNALCASSHVLIPTALTPMSQSGAVTFGEYLSTFRKSLCPRLQTLAILPTLTHGTLTPPELKALGEIAKRLPGVAIWEDCFIPRRQAIADNEVHKHPESREKFLHLAKRVIQALGLSADGAPEGRGAYRSSQSGGARYSQ